MDSEKSPREDDIALQSATDAKYTVFTVREKWWISILVSYAAFFSTLSSFIYYPAIPAMSESLSVSVEKINWTVTSYMAVATIGPTLVGDMADMHGRRTVYILTLSLYAATNVLIAAIKSYPALVGLRVLQALAISGTFSIAYGVVTDIASPAERGTFASIVSFAITIAPTLGPILGGSLTYAASWTWIFWFLSLASGLCLLLMIFTLPETARNLVGNGSVEPPKVLQLPVPFDAFAHWKTANDGDRGQGEDVPEHKWSLPNPFKSLKILIRKDNFIIILACGLLYVVYTCINTSLSVLFVNIYGLNQWQAGLIYVPFGAGGIVSTLFSGRLLNKSYRKAREKLGSTVSGQGNDNLDEFPVEKARIAVIWLPLSLTVVCVLVFGWLLHIHTHIAVLLCIQFVIGLCMQLDFSVSLLKATTDTLLEKLTAAIEPAATAQASSNIVRCSLAAITVTFLQQAFDSMGIGWTFTLMSGLCIIDIVLFAIDYRWGIAWRQKSLA